jgi:hypothetical protein
LAKRLGEGLAKKGLGKKMNAWRNKKNNNMKAWQKRRESADTPEINPAGEIDGITTIRRRHSIFFKTVALIVVFVFSLQQVVQAQGGTPIWQHAKPQGATIHFDKAKLNGLSIPYVSGKTEDAYANGGEKVVINIQDDHSSLSAQKSIVNVLDSLVSNYDLSLIAVEGSEGYIDTSILRTFPKKDARKATADYLMKKGKMSAGEFFTVVSEKPIALYGVEDDELYKENVASFRSVIEDRAISVQNTEALERALKTLAKHIYSEELREFNKKTRQHKEGRLSFSEYWKDISRLAKGAKIDAESYPNTSKLLDTLKLEGKIDFAKANSERKELIDELSKALNKEKLEVLVLKSLSYKMGNISQAEFHQYLVYLAEDKGISPASYKNLINFTRYISIYETIDILALYKEIKELERAVRESLFADKDEEALYGLQEKVRILKGLFAVTLDNGDVDHLIRHRAEFKADVFASFIRKNYKKYNLIM